MLRPEAVSVTDAGQANTLKATVEQISYQGSIANLHGRLTDGSTLVASVPPDTLRGLSPGAAANLAIRANAMRWFDGSQ
ncbi:TOBE domain-containing protein [Bosea sp. RAF48]|uniref:TOBE domain-containing protein n=1 Tax=Bosea sp. RAF48 TaxID=3237480 RepID=UPI003F8EB56B